jgi:hypothetical protein
MAWCTGRAIALPTPSALFHHTGSIMKSNREEPKPTVLSGTIEADGGSGEMIAVARAQRELIDMLARLVLAAVEQERDHGKGKRRPPIRPAVRAEKEVR